MAAVKRPHQGFTLLEVLIVMVVLAIGLLGIAGLLLSNVRSSSNSAWRTQAALLAEEAAERIRTNSYWVASGTAASLSLSVSPTYAVNCSTASMPVAPACTSAASGVLCGSTLLWRNQDVFELCSKVGDVAQGGLPSGTLTIAQEVPSASEGVLYRITLSWVARTASSSSGGTVQSYETLLRP
ncbi:type IV pilus modification protein PilV [Gulbenkiania indica]|uniref:Type IV pilus modification protein PilV n=1 Tax=Gulbenkiania indica TaxID=375574 RepID=A0A0K6GU67_9NEIS|nr:type IV pilus modification protein PilV [Gulbenkiania indica]CUA82057.1 type IV pilus modification protein PilV [Gulbenkiania indica]